MKKYILFLAYFLCATVYGALPTRIGNNLIVNGSITPEVANQDLGSSNFRWDLFAHDVNTQLSVGAAYINANGSVASLSSVTPTALGYIGDLNSMVQAQIDAIIGGSTFITLPNGSIWIGNSSNQAQGRSVFGDVAITNAGQTSIGAGVITNSQINAAAGIVDTKLATIATAGKVSNSATTATSSSVLNSIVSRDSSSNFSANQITATLIGNVTGNVTGNVVGNLTGNVNGSVVGNVTGNVTGDVTGNLTGNVTGTASGNPPNARLINTTAPLTGGGNLSADRTIAMPAATSTVDGYLLAANFSTFNLKMSNVFTTLGDTVYSIASGIATRLAGNITTTKKFMTQTGDGANSAAPGWNVIVGTDLPNPSSSSLGGIQSYAAVTHQWINSISTSGVPTSTQPAFTDISGTALASQGGTSTTTVFTQGSIVFSGASGIYSQDNSKFYWDDTNFRLGLGVTSPNFKIHQDGGNATATYHQFTNGTTTGTTSTDGTLFGSDASGNGVINVQENLPLIISTNGTEAMRVQANQSVLFKGPILLEDPGAGTSTVNIKAGTMVGPTYSVTLPLVQCPSGSIWAFTDGVGTLGCSANGTGGGGSSSTSRVYSAYNGDDCTWPTTSTSSTDPTSDASCTLTVTRNDSIGTVTQAGGANALPGLVFTPTATGNYTSCFTLATVRFTATGIGGNFVAVLKNTTTSVVYGGVGMQNTNAALEDIETPGTVCATEQLTAATAYTIKWQFKVQGTGATVTTGNTSVYNNVVVYSIVLNN